MRGTSSCGGGPGFLLLIATFVVCVLLGSALLGGLIGWGLNVAYDDGGWAMALGHQTVVLVARAA